MTGLRDSLQAILVETGRLTPGAVVDAARPESHPLHNRFEWDNAVAGEGYRRMQAQQLIRSVKVVYSAGTETDSAKSVRSFIAVPGPDGSSYQPVEDVALDEFTRELVLREMERDWKALHRRYATFAEFAELVRASLDVA